jgi:hypothetical protein
MNDKGNSFLIQQLLIRVDQLFVRSLKHQLHQNRFYQFYNVIYLLLWLKFLNLLGHVHTVIQVKNYNQGLR